ncbi:MAG: peptidoglycan-associated lipoprotein Pal [Pseudomonadales bacterium]|nr:peptidoglycan-associated lipoprotein Pal [Halieaceae bacterium]MCP5165631.1 peptidoglycan-associated lipoprotein Pal [Pseudomonadales bacterium]MCP5168068.1 peptidoglycan-associated lipoprotein Pal [Pseudomonadales bacterium]MCP5205504.1 peptidoglycan-associated lipoprotein Pal [Pseudomonadales bacterium]
MKHVSVAGKLMALVLSAAFLVACSSSSTKEDEEAARAAAAAAAAAKAAQDAAAASGSATASGTGTATSQEQQRLEQAAAAYGNVFYFAFDSSNLTPEAIASLNAHIAALKNTNSNIRLEGHTDERGTREYNLALGERRANSVRDYMVLNGIASYRIETISYGEERPIAYGSGEANWAQNRRVELVVVK